MLKKTEYIELETIRDKIVDNTAESNDLLKFLDLMLKSDKKSEVNDYIHNAGINNIDNLKENIKEQTINKNIIKGLAVLGSAVLLIYILNKK